MNSMSENFQRRSQWLASAIMPHEPALRAWLLGKRFPGIDIDDIVQEAYSTLAALDSERANLVEAVVVADQHGFYDLVWQLCEALWSLFFRLGHHEDWVRVHQLGVKAATELEDLRADDPQAGRTRARTDRTGSGSLRHAPYPLRCVGRWG